MYIFNGMLSLLWSPVSREQTELTYHAQEGFWISCIMMTFGLFNDELNGESDVYHCIGSGNFGSSHSIVLGMMDNCGSRNRNVNSSISLL